MYRDSAKPDRSLLIVALNGDVAAIDRETGNKRWHRVLEGSKLGPVAIAVVGDAVYAAGRDDSVACFAYDSGTRRWAASTEASGPATLIVDGEQIFVARRGMIECLDRETGTRVWVQALRGMGTGETSMALPPRDGSSGGS